MSFYLLIITFSSIISILLSSIFFSNSKSVLAFGLDNKEGTQKLHLIDSTRLGGLSIIISTYLLLIFEFDNPYFLIIFYISWPIFLIGFIEDITNKLSAYLRLLSLFIACSIPVVIFDFTIKEKDIFLLNLILFLPFSLVIFSIFGIVVTCNAWNFIDGLNGLSSFLGFSIIMFFSYMAKVEGLNQLAEVLFLISLIIFCFLIINIATAKIFLGDSGAYFIGLIVALSGIELSNKSEQISAWMIFFIISYPATEIIFTFFRRVFQKRSIFKPDNKHLHSVVFKLINKINLNISEKNYNTFSGLVCSLIGIIPIIFFLIFNSLIKIVFMVFPFFVFLFYFIFNIMQSSNN